VPQVNTEWSMVGQYMKNCSCAPGCPCDFWAEPTHHFCAGMAAMHIERGHFGPTKLDGLRWLVTYHWPGPLHEGNGTFCAYVDERADEQQRTALLTILSGKAGNAWFEVLASVVKTILPPKFVKIEWEFDLASRHARAAVPGEVETVTEPIRDLVSGKDHHILVKMPNGMEYFEPEIATTKVLRSTGPIKFDHPGAHSSLANVVHTQAGLQREAARK
jgi:hypothetical protein